MNDYYDKFLDIDYLKSFNTDPQWFGLGFIQLKLDEKKRIHFYHPDLRPDVKEEIHNHRDSFFSHVLYGEINQNLYNYVEGRESGAAVYDRFDVTCSEEGEDKFLDSGYFTETFSSTLSAGSSYFINLDQFHDIDAEKAITLVERKSVGYKKYAQVIRRSDSPKTCPFERKIPVDKLWEYIRELIPNNGYHESNIKKGDIGKLSKIREEIDELIDSNNQDIRIMELVEMSDIIGAVESYLDLNHSDYSIHDLIKMSDATKRAFKNGHR